MAGHSAIPPPRRVRGESTCGGRHGLPVFRAVTTETSTEVVDGRPGDAWRRALTEAAPPRELVEAAPPRPQHLETEMFRWRPGDEEGVPIRPSRRRALEALPEGGTVLDVGVGGGRSSLPLGVRASRIVGVDRSEDMLASFEASARDAGIDARGVLGTWPGVASEVEPADLVVCHNAVYGEGEIEPFLDALTGHARRRVVVEVSTVPPPWGLAQVWRAVHGTDRPVRPVADLLQGVLAAMGIEAGREDVVVPGQAREVTPERVAFARRRLYVGEERDEEIAELLRTLPPVDVTVAALWWPGTA